MFSKDQIKVINQSIEDSMVVDPITLKKVKPQMSPDQEINERLNVLRKHRKHISEF